MTAPLRIGIVGSGAIVRQRHLPNFRELDGIEFPVVCDAVPEVAAAFAKDFNIPQTVADWREVIARPDLDAILIGTTPHMHAPVAVAALDAGKHVLCQARMSRNLAEAKTMLAAAKAHPGQVAMLCPPPNAMKHGLYLAELLRQRRIGDLFHFNLRSLLSPWADPNSPTHWRQRTDLSGFNILSVGIYAEVLARFFGNAEELCAHGSIHIAKRPGHKTDVPDTVQVIGRWPHGLEGVLQWSGVAQFGGGDLLEIFGSEGTLVYDFATDEIRLGQRGAEKLVTVPVPPEYVRTWTVERDFVQGIREKKNPQPDFQTGFHYMEFVEAVHQSMERRAWVSIADL